MRRNCKEVSQQGALKDSVICPCTGTEITGLKKNWNNIMPKVYLENVSFLPSEKCVQVLKGSEKKQNILFSVLLCYLSCAWSWEWHRALSLGRHLCAVDHDSVRVWLCTSLQNKLYLFPPPVSRLLEGEKNPPTKALQEGCSGCGSGRQLSDRKRHKRRQSDTNIIISVFIHSNVLDLNPWT